MYVTHDICKTFLGDYSGCDRTSICSSLEALRVRFPCLIPPRPRPPVLPTWKRSEATPHIRDPFAWMEPLQWFGNRVSGSEKASVTRRGEIGNDSKLDLELAYAARFLGVERDRVRVIPKGSASASRKQQQLPHFSRAVFYHLGSSVDVWISLNSHSPLSQPNRMCLSTARTDYSRWCSEPTMSTPEKTSFQLHYSPA